MNAPARSSSLASVLHRAQLRVALVALLTVGLLLSCSSFLSLRSSLAHNLELVGRSISYSVEAAVMFQDSAATEQVLKNIVDREGLNEARVVLSNGTQLAAYQRPGQEGRLPRLARWLFPMQTSSSVQLDGVEVARVELQSDSVALLLTLAWSLGAILLGILLTALTVLWVSRRIERIILVPLQALAQHTRSVRQERAYSRRAPKAQVKEIDELGADFNALLTEVQANEAELHRRHEALRSDNDLLSFSARHDALTGAANRAYFEQELQDSIAEAKLKDTGLALLFLDADKFKDVNDRYGHDAGDKVLIELAQRMRANVRDTDLVGRLGGDEFVILLRPLRQSGDAVRIQQQLQASLRDTPIAIGAGVSLTMSASIGIAAFPQDGDSAESLLRNADMAMYREKSKVATRWPSETSPASMQSTTLSHLSERGSST